MEPEAITLTENDVYTLIGHAEFLRLCRGEHDMPDYFFGLAERIAMHLSNPELAARASAIRSGTAPAQEASAAKQPSEPAASHAHRPRS